MIDDAGLISDSFLMTLSIVGIMGMIIAGAYEIRKQKQRTR